MKNKNQNKSQNDPISIEEPYVATECICDDDGVHYICPTCGKYHKEDLDALFCCMDK